MVDGINSPILAVLHWVLWALGTWAVGGGASFVAVLRASEADHPRDRRGDAPRDLVDVVIEKILDWCRGGWGLQPARLRLAPRDRSRPPRDR
ncbi:MAG: hypothetical protein WD066_08795 [Planctomycetaceae bacterium]